MILITKNKKDFKDFYRQNSTKWGVLWEMIVHIILIYRILKVN